MQSAKSTPPIDHDTFAKTHYKVDMAATLKSLEAIKWTLILNDPRIHSPIGNSDYRKIALLAHK